MKIADYNGRNVTLELEMDEIATLAPVFRDLSQGIGSWNPKQMEEIAEIFEECLRVEKTLLEG